MKAESQDRGAFWEKLERLDYRVLYYLLVILIAVPYLKPFGLPIPITKPVQAMYDTLDKLPQGSMMIIDISAGPPGYAEIGPGATALMKFVTQIYPARHGGGRLKVLMTSISEEGPLMYEAFVKPELDKSPFKYGVDYVYFGFISGLETAVARLADNIPSLLRSDYYNNRAEDLPMMKGVNSYKEIAAVVVLDIVSVTPWWIKHWALKGVKVANVCSAIYIPQYTAFVQSGDMFGFLGSARGVAEFEQLIGIPGLAAATTDTLSISHLYIIFLIIIGNIPFLAKKYLPPRKGGS